jgi:23S rRNA (uracil1939-C5)-methyltransferase
MKNARPKASETISLSITELDSFGQGIGRNKDKIYYIKNALPSEEIIADVLKSQKQLAFGVCPEVIKPSPQRQESSCEYFPWCGGCHYWHVSYSSELQNKMNALNKELSKSRLNYPIMEVINSHQRTQYRNRIQLHYDQKQKKMGFFAENSHQIIPIKKCLLAPNIINDELSKITSQNFPDHPAKGHLEISSVNHENSNEVKVTYNEKYSASGFTQVNPWINLKLQEKINQYLENSDHDVLELFAGNGNLTQIAIAQQNKNFIHVDYYPSKNKKSNSLHSHFHSLDLFAEKSLTEIKRICSTYQVKTLIVDPPRSGFNLLNLYLNELKPQQVIYVSCWPSTLARDLKTVESSYQINRLSLLDMFPLTKHFETVVCLQRI